MTSGLYKPQSNGLIFDIQGLSVHDGPGCRTVIFMNACSMRCFWCSNPEGMSHQPVLMYFNTKCIRCGNCAEKCPSNAIFINNDQLSINRELCKTCISHDCIKECYSGALRLSSYEISADKLMATLQRDRQYWGPEGGVTLTGGEPLMQIVFAKEILKRCHDSYIHTAIETCGNIPWENFQEVIDVLDWIFFDLKHTTDADHKKATQVGNTLILENAARLAREFQGRLIFRMPLIPGFNDSPENINALILFIKASGRIEINILPLHHLGREKYNILQQEYPGKDIPLPTAEQLQLIKEMFGKEGIHCYIGSETPF